MGNINYKNLDKEKLIEIIKDQKKYIKRLENIIENFNEMEEEDFYSESYILYGSDDIYS